LHERYRHPERGSIAAFWISQGHRLLALRGEYEELRRLLKNRLREAENQILVTVRSDSSGK
jgi:hypothetical protein